MVLPLDGFIFWLRRDLVSQSALFNASNLNAVQLNQPPVTVTSAPFLNVQGSLHYATIKEQAEDSTVAVNTVIFTALSLVQDFNQIGPNVIYIATFGELQFAFSQQAPYYQQANTYHYQGQAIYSTMESQIINNLAGFDDSSVVVSNSLPLWLALNGYIPSLSDVSEYELSTLSVVHGAGQFAAALWCRAYRAGGYRGNSVGAVAGR